MDKKNIAIILVGVLFILVLLAILFFVPPEAVWLVLITVAVISAFYFISRIIQRQQIRESKPRAWHNLVSLLTIFALIFILFIALLNYAVPSILTIIITVAVLFTVFINFLTVPLAIYHKMKEKKAQKRPVTVWPSISIIVPAYNEEKMLSGTIEALLECDYPDKEIIIVDDGSQDSTYSIALRYRSPKVKVIHRENGGKYAALNTGLVFASGDIIVTVDADSLIARTGLREIIRGFTSPDVVGVAGNLKVLNRNKFLTNLQALEYLIQMNVIRRAFENFGAITVASGAFSAFRREAINQCGRYDPDYLLEDFDITIKLLKSHRIVSGNIDALCYTEAPENLHDIYKQRLSWYRGDFQNFWKHRDTLFNPRFGFMHKLTFPYMVLTMTLVPICSVLVVVSTILAIMAGQWLILIYAFVFFVVMQFFQCLLGILIAEDDLKLVWYSPLFIIGYKQFLDFVMLKALFDIILARGYYMKRERVRRIGTVERVALDSKAAQMPVTQHTPGT